MMQPRLQLTLEPPFPPDLPSVQRQPDPGRDALRRAPDRQHRPRQLRFMNWLSAAMATIASRLPML